MTVHTLQLVEVDADPIMFYDRRVPEYADLPEPYASTLQDVIDHPDDRLCHGCGKGVGYVLKEHGDDGREDAFWDWLTIMVSMDGVVSLLCEDCTPWLPLSTPR